MSNVNPFILPVDHYERDLDFIPAYLEDHALYLSTMTGDPIEECLEYVKAQSRAEGEFALNNPKVLVLNKKDNGDKELMQTTLMGFTNRIAKQQLTLAPSLSSYYPENIVSSSHASYIEEGVENRAATRREQYRLEGLATVESIAAAKVKRGEQENYKLNNNSYSGATLSQATILYNRSTHPALTSTCRLATSLANSNNEKFIIGNRHYYNPEITKSNILSIANLTDLELLKDCMERYNLHWPTADELVDVVLYSSKSYFHGNYFTESIRKLANGLSPLQRAAVVYVSDLYHLYQYNKELVKNMLLKLSELGNIEDGYSKEQYGKLDEDIKLASDFMCFEYTKGRNHERLSKESPETLELIYATGKNIVKVLDEYRLLYQALFLTKNMPSSIHAFPTAYRKTVVLSDTDSTVFSLQYWIAEIFGRVVFTPEALRMSFGLTFLISETVMHLLALQSANMGVSKERLRQLAMKNEYFFAIMSLTNSSKHYFASQDGIEGLMLLKPRLEIKGRGLRGSKIPVEIARKSEVLIEDLINDIRAGRQIHLKAILSDIANTEREIINSIKTGKANYLLTGNVKRLNAYRSPDNPTYAKHTFWKEVFTPKYGEIPEPPYSFYKIKVITDNRTRWNEWLDTIDDVELVARLKLWESKAKGTGIAVHHIPFEVVENMGVPEVITRVADYRSAVFQTMEAFYLILEALGCYFIDKDVIRLVSDYY